MDSPHIGGFVFGVASARFLNGPGNSVKQQADRVRVREISTESDEIGPDTVIINPATGPPGSCRRGLHSAGGEDIFIPARVAPRDRS